jgi:hypothetical protein
MKKTKPKALSAPTPAPKAAVKPAPKPAAKKKSSGRSAPAAEPTAPAVKPGVPVPVLTVVTAHIDIGFGNTLYLRGQGPGLSWDRGLPLECADDNAWTITLPETARPIICKFLVNDLTWSAGSDYVVQPGSTVTYEPTF